VWVAGKSKYFSKLWICDFRIFGFRIFGFRVLTTYRLKTYRSQGRPLAGQSWRRRLSLPSEESKHRSTQQRHKVVRLWPLPELENSRTCFLLRGTLAPWIIGVLNKQCSWGTAQTVRNGSSSMSTWSSRCRSVPPTVSWVSRDVAGRHGQSNQEIEDASCVDQYG
jgi:hypothetical protein